MTATPPPPPAAATTMTMTASLTMTEGEANLKMQKIVDMTRAAVDRGESALLWALDVVRFLDEAALQIPSIELAQTLVSCVFSFNSACIHTFSTYLYHAMASQLVFPFHVLLLLTPRVFQTRTSRPELFAMYLELASTYIFRIKFTKTLPSFDMIARAADEAMQSVRLPGMPISDFGTAAVQFTLMLVLRLMEATLEDWVMCLGRPMQNPNQHETAMDVDECVDEKQKAQREQMRSANCITAVDLVSKVIQNKKTLWLLRLARRSMLDQWNMVIRCLHSLEALPKDALFTAPKGAIESITNLLRSYQKGLCQDVKPHQFPVVEVLLESRTSSWSYGNCSELGCAATWLPIDIFLEAAVVRRRVLTTSVVEALADLVKSLQSLHDVLWHEMFLALWLAALRLVQRDLDNIEGPEPHSESRLCILLAVVPLAASLLIDEEEKQSSAGSDGKSVSINEEKDQKVLGHRRDGFTSSLKMLGQFEGLLSPPPLVAAAVHQAGLSAAAFVAGFNSGNMSFEGLGTADVNSGIKTAANLWHLIVETCIARGLLDTSVYLWPGYIGALSSNLSISSPSQVSPWNNYMEGASLSGSIKILLASIPAKRMMELEKIYQAAVTGPEDERPAAASILCGASLIRGWNIQEHAIYLVLRLLSPPVSAESRANGHFLIPHAPVLHAVLVAISSEDALHVMLLYGMFPELVAALLPICEVFGSLSPTMSVSSGPKEEVSVLTLFSMAFLVLIKILKFHTPPAEHRSAGMLEYLLTRYNMQIASSKGTSEKTVGDGKGSSSQYITMDSFPKLKGWLLQNQSCSAATLSELAHNDSLHQVVDRLIGMIMKKASKTGSLPTTPGTSVSNTGNTDESGAKPLLPAWDLLAATPFVVDALLTACGHGKLSPRDLTTGLRDLVDFFPASLASIISYLEAEVTRGLWKPASMNGKDWPSPAATLLSVETEIREMLTAVGVNKPKFAAGSMPGNLLVSLPLPLAALLSLTITFKVDKNSEMVLSVAGPALQNIAGDTYAVAALWVQKVRRWHDFIIFGSAQCAIKKDKSAAAQLLVSCFSATLGTSVNLPCKLTAHGGVGALLGHGSSRCALTGGYAIPPGIFYFRIVPILHDIMFLPSQILELLVNSVRDLGVGASSAVTSKSGSRLRCVHPSLATTISRVSQASNLAASLLSLSGGTALVKLLYVETLPTWFLAGKEPDKALTANSGGTALLEGYAMAYFALLSGLFVWGTSQTQESSSSRKSTIGSHIRFLAAALEGKVFLACDITTWKSYITAFVSLIIVCASNWISDIEVESLTTIATTLSSWREHELAMLLLEARGPAAVGVAGEFVVGSF